MLLDKAIADIAGDRVGGNISKFKVNNIYEYGKSNTIILNGELTGIRRWTIAGELLFYGALTTKVTNCDCSLKGVAVIERWSFKVRGICGVGDGIGSRYDLKLPTPSDLSTACAWML